MWKKALFYLAVTSLIFGGQFFFDRGLVTGQPPAISQKTIAGQEVMAQIADGPAIIYFWAEWCGICNRVKGSLDAVFQHYPGVTIAVRSGDDDKLSDYLRRNRLDWKVVNDDNGELADRFGVKGVPALFFINADGKIVLTSTGYISASGLRFRLWLAGMLPSST